MEILSTTFKYRAFFNVNMRSTYRRFRIRQKKNIYSDEAHFDLGGYVNKQNCRNWGTENPHSYIEKPTHPKWFTVWSRGIIGPFFFENEQGESITVNGDRYRAMLNEYLFTYIEEEDIDNIRFQQDGATCHTAETTFDFFRPVFEDHIISRITAIWHRWTIICGVPSKPETIDALNRQYAWSHWWNTAAHNR